MVLDLPAPAIIFWGEDQTQIYNDGYAVIMGPQRHPRFLGGPYRLCWPDTYPTIYPWMRRVLDQGEVVEVDRALIPVTRHGFNEEAYFTFTFSPLRDDNGHIAGILQLVTEVTESTLAESRLATLHALETAAVPQAGTMDRLSQVLARNPQNIPFALIYLRGDDAHGLCLALSIGEQSSSFQTLGVEDCMRAAAAAYTSGQVLGVQGDGETFLAPEPGEQKPLRGALALPLHGPRNARPLGVLLLGANPVLAFGSQYEQFFRDVARTAAILLAAEERTREQLQLQQSERKAKRELQLALRSGQMATWYIELATHKATISAEVARIFGVPYVESEDVASVIDRVIHPDDKDEANRVLGAAVSNLCFYSHEYRVLWPSGEERWVLSQGDKVTDADDTAFAYAGVILDITERKRAEVELKAALRSRDEFLSIASHELNTPLTSLKLQAQMAMRSIAHADAPALSPERMAKFIQHTDRQADRLARLVEDMLDISRIQAGMLSMRPESLSLAELVLEVVDRLKPAMAAAQTPVHLVCHDRGNGVWDRLRLEQVVTNLLTNAMRYGAKRPVAVELSRREKVVRLDVRDQGLGIDSQALELIFSRFERQVDAREVSGLGLGLYITRNIVSAHGGHIWAESAGKGCGSTFVVELPLDSYGLVTI